ncbi:hypothetical protein AMTRI_Chr13g120900 [Amborella trichopoda]
MAQGCYQLFPMAVKRSKIGGNIVRDMLGIIIIGDDRSTIILSTPISKPSSIDPGQRPNRLRSDCSFPFSLGIFSNFNVHIHLHILFDLLLHLSFLDVLFNVLVLNNQRGKKRNHHFIQHFAN